MYNAVLCAHNYLSVFYSALKSIFTNERGVVEQQLGEKPPRTSTCPLEENPGPAEPLNQRPPGLGPSKVGIYMNRNRIEIVPGTSKQKTTSKNVCLYIKTETSYFWNN